MRSDLFIVVYHVDTLFNRMLSLEERHVILVASFLFLFLCEDVSDCLNEFLSLSVCLPLTDSVSVVHSLSGCVCLCVCLSLYLCVSESLGLSDLPDIPINKNSTRV